MKSIRQNAAAINVPLTKGDMRRASRKLTRLLLEAPETVTELFETQELVDWLNHIVIPMKDYELTREYTFALDKYLAYIAIHNLSLRGV